MTHEHEVVILGAGPAGSAAALVLAREGHDVAIIRPGSTPQGALCESIPPSARKLLAEIDVLEPLERSGFYPNHGNIVWWAERPERRESFAIGERGFHVDRRGLEDALVSVASARGVTVHDGLARNALNTAEGWRTSFDAPDGSRAEIRGRWLLDATGRRGLIARREGREHDPDTTTLCLLGRMRRQGGWDPSTDGHTLVESHSSGWAWSVPLAHDLRCFAAMVDHRHEALAGLDVATMLAAELNKTEHLSAMLGTARPAGLPWACPASLYESSRYGRPGLLLVGEAGSSIDPLSSYGVKKALSSGWLAGVVAHTALVDPATEAAAIAFFDRREREVYRRYREASTPYFAEAAETYGHRYWQSRAAASASLRAPGDAARDPDGLESHGLPEARIRAAFEVIRGRERLDAVPGATLRGIERAAIEGYRVVHDVHLASDTHPEGLRFVRAVDVRRLVDLAGHHADVAELWAAYNAVAPPVPLPDFVTALATVFAAGLLEHRSG